MIRLANSIAMTDTIKLSIAKSFTLSIFVGAFITSFCHFAATVRPSLGNSGLVVSKTAEFLFIIFELIAQGYLVYHFYKLKVELKDFVNRKVLFIKIFLVSVLVLVAVLSLPTLVTKGNTHFKHMLEWNYFVGVILFYLLSRFFWRRTT